MSAIQSALMAIESCACEETLFTSGNYEDQHRLVEIPGMTVDDYRTRVLKLLDGVTPHGFLKSYELVGFRDPSEAWNVVQFDKFNGTIFGTPFFISNGRMRFAGRPKILQVGETIPEFLESRRPEMQEFNPLYQGARNPHIIGQEGFYAVDKLTTSLQKLAIKQEAERVSRFEFGRGLALQVFVNCCLGNREGMAGSAFHVGCTNCQEEVKSALEKMGKDDLGDIQIPDFILNLLSKLHLGYDARTQLFRLKTGEMGSNSKNDLELFFGQGVFRNSQSQNN